MITSREMVMAALVWLAVLVANLSTATRSPTAWHDEVYFADPAIHFAEGEGFRTTAWAGVSEEVYWVGLVPGYGYALGVCLKAFGVGLWQVRALPILLAAIAAACVWWTARKRGHVTSAVGGLVLLAMLLCGAGVVFSYRSGRGDALAMLWWAVAYAAVSRRAGFQPAMAARMAALLVALGAAAPWCGLYLTSYLMAAGGVILAFGGRPWLARVSAMWLGLAVGAVSLVGFFWATGAWEAFLSCVRHYQTGVLSPDVRLEFGGFEDLSLLLAWLGLVIVLVAVKRMDPLWRWAMAVVLGVPATGIWLAASGKFPFYYSWLLSFPAMLALAHALQQQAKPEGTLEARPPGWRPVCEQCGLSMRWLIFCLVGLACLVGLPARVGLTLLEWDMRDHRRVERFAEAHFVSGDRVACDYSAYFAVRRAGAEPYPGALDERPLESAEAKRAITAACVRPEIDGAGLGAALGGRWRRVAAIGENEASGRWRRAVPYRLVVYRRAE